MDYLYRYRSIKSLFKYKELEKLSIYFAKPEELNDQMEKYMNVVWQGDEIAFQGLFKHYIYILACLYYEARIRNPKKHIKTEELPVFLDIKVLEAPEMQDLFKAIYNEFFDSPGIAQLPKLLAASNRKFNIDEILLLLKVIHLYAYFVIDNKTRKMVLGQDVFQDTESEEIYEMTKNFEGYSHILEIITDNKFSSQDKDKAKEIFSTAQQMYKKHLNEVDYKDNDTHNINILSFDYPEAYIKNITKLLYGSFCVACFSATYQNEPMWAHYADCEKGVCLEYKIKKENSHLYLKLCSVTGESLSSGADKSKVIRNFHLDSIFPINYSSEYPEIDFFTSLARVPVPVIENFWLCNYDKTKFSSCLKKYNPIEEWRKRYFKKAQEYICTKAENWKYEQEYRIFYQDNSFQLFETAENRVANYSIDDLESVIFGRNVSAEEKRKIINILSGHCKGKTHAIKFYDLHYSTITKQLERIPCIESLPDIFAN